MSSLLLLLASLSGALGVTLGAFGAHALRGRLQPGQFETFETAVRYHLIHALALLAAALMSSQLADSTFLQLTGWLFFSGILLFSGSLYALALSGRRWFGAITPFGGLAFIAGWVCLGLTALGL